ncbi:MAG: DNA replication and repair protein RecF [Candidatus Cloacimonadaceae bacterium]
MKLLSIHLTNFRNYTDREFLCSDEGALVLGPNGSGKTNLFEAIAYSSYGKSFKYQADDLLLNFGQRAFSITADFELKMGRCSIRTDYAFGKKKISINQIPVRQLSQIYEYVKVIYCSPEDIYLVNGSPRKRRQYLDLAIAQLRPPYINQLRHYLHIVEQRNTLLKDNSNRKQKKHWDNLFIKAALPVIAQRLEYTDLLNTKIHHTYKNTLAETDLIKIRYVPTLIIPDEVSDSDYSASLKAVESREWQYQRSLIGPHLDDYDISLNGRLLKDIGSQGQKRTVTLLIKIAHLELLKDVIGEYPILLLDDIFAELDKAHTQSFMNILSSHEQVFVASPNAFIRDYWKGIPVIDLTAGAQN